MAIEYPDGLRLWVYRSSIGNCTNGPSRTCEKVTLVGTQPERRGLVDDLPCRSRQFPPTDEAPAVILRPSNLPGGPPILVLAEHAHRLPPGMVGPMFGGNYAGGSDSRIGDAAARFGEQWRHSLFALHDRTETQEQYNALSV